MPTTLAPALGPVLGGVLVTEASWRWVFYVNVPIGAAALLFGLLFLDGGSEHRPGRFDAAGFALAGAGFGALMFGVSEGPSRHWESVPVLATMCAGVVLLAVLVRAELASPRPLIDLRLLGNRLFRSCCAVMVLASVAFIGTLYLASLFFQDGRGLSGARLRVEHLPRGVRRHGRSPAGQPGAVPAARAAPSHLARAGGGTPGRAGERASLQDPQVLFGRRPDPVLEFLQSLAQQQPAPRCGPASSSACRERARCTSLAGRRPRRRPGRRTAGPS